ncbi:MAG: 1-acyl-sn-glycerol-3-phosphate acyltransferase [Acidobacteria bacterium]|nr:1-acyl-sn-glycerol-3-phosphate acyltransferase [Acidobacteriota bacterium]
MTESYEPFDPEYLRELEKQVFGDIFRTYFRPLLIGADKIPRDRGAILAPNHSGNAFPYDAMVLDAKIWEHDQFNPALKLRSVFEKELAVTWWMRPFGIDNFWRRGGGVDLTFDNFEHLVKAGKRLIYFPEGVPGIGKGFNRRYQLQPFSTSFVLISARNKTPVIPIYAINCEWIIPFCYTFKGIDWFVFKFFGVPFLPLPAAPLGFLFPWMWYAAMPVRMIFVVGDPIDTAELTRQHGITDLEDPDRAQLKSVSEAIRVAAQAELNKYVRKYGKRPYDFRSFWKRMKKTKWWARTPLSWPWLFLCHERNRFRKPAKNAVVRWLRDWDLLAFYLPLGWFVLSLTRRFRKPPYGYRGMSAEEKRMQCGEFTWHLKDRPLSD